jgi:hypothetical protein
VATIPLSITVPDAQMARVQAACRASFGQVPDGTADPVTGLPNLRDLTNQEIIERLRQSVITQIKTMVSNTERAAARAAAEALQPNVDAS